MCHSCHWITIQEGRLRERRGEMLRFMTDQAVPFYNNWSECDLRMVKLQQKIGGRFRTGGGGLPSAALEATSRRRIFLPPPEFCSIRDRLAEKRFNIMLAM